MINQFFITATGTEIGKSYYLNKFCQKLKKDNQDFFAIKPVISGFEYGNAANDISLILNSLGLDYNKKNIDKISLYQFEAALSPNIAAKIDNKKINYDSVVNFCKKHIKLSQEKNQYLLIEGAGGVMTPIDDDNTFLDLISDLNISVILLSSDYLGTISHTLTAIEVLKSRNIKIDRLVLNKMGLKNENLLNFNNLKNFYSGNIEILA